MPSVFVPGKLRNHMNTRTHWRVESAYRKRWREAVKVAVLMAKVRLDPPGMPKTVWLRAYTWGHLDPDGLIAACKPILDGLRDSGVIDDDSQIAGHDFRYEQEINRRFRGIRITWERR